MSITLIHHRYHSIKDVNKKILNDTNELNTFLSTFRQARENKSNSIVYVWSSSHSHDEVIVTENIALIESVAKNVLDYSDCEVYLQEYSSYKDAYEVALNMREGNPLCYN